MPLGHFGDLHVMPPSVCFLLRMPSFLLLTWPLPAMDAKYSLGEGPPQQGGKRKQGHFNVSEAPEGTAPGPRNLDSSCHRFHTCKLEHGKADMIEICI